MAESGVNTEELYKCYEVLNSSVGDVSQHQKEYEVLLDATTRGEPSLKRFVPSIVVKFVDSFPSLHTRTLHCICDLLEDADSSVRLAAVKCLPAYAASCPNEVSRVADVLAQMLSSDEAVEVAAVKRSLLSILKASPKDCMNGMFAMLSCSEEEASRSKALQFIGGAITSLKGELYGNRNHANESHIVTLIGEVLVKLPPPSHGAVLSLLSLLALAQAPAGAEQVLGMLAEAAHLDAAFQPGSSDAVQRLMECTKEAVLWSQRGGRPARFYEFVVLKVLPAAEGLEPATRQELLRLLTSLVTFDLPVDALTASAASLLASIQELIPTPTGSEDLSSQEWKFPDLECLLFAFHHVVPKAGEWPGRGEWLKDLRPRLTLLSRACQQEASRLVKGLAGKTDKELLQQECRDKKQSKLCVDNICLLTRDFFHNPPSCKTAVKLSFVRPNPYDKKAGRAKTIYTGRPFTGATPTPISPGFNRKRDSNGGQDQSPARKEGKAQITKIVYEPPKGTYSSQLGLSEEKWAETKKRGVSTGSRGRGRGWQASPNRGRGRGQKWNQGW